MKYLIIMTQIYILCSCSDPKGQIIQDYEENIMGVKTDLSFKLKDLKFDRNITGLDSMRSIHEGNIKGKEFDPEVNWIDTLVDNYIEMITSSREYIEKYDSLKNSTSDFDSKRIYLEAQGRVITEMRGELTKKAEWDPIKLQYDKYIPLQDTIIGKLYSATYTIKNPLLNNAVQTIPAQYVFSPNEDRILSKVDKE